MMGKSLEEQQRIHMCYSLNQDRMYEVKKLQTNIQQEGSPYAFFIKKDDIVIADTGVIAKTPFSP